jgi:murein DD-endopeptidase MepM/ murein hydrolase activator NlpD
MNDKGDEVVASRVRRTSAGEVEPSAVLPTRSRMLTWLAIGAAILSIGLWALGGWLAFRFDRRLDLLDDRVQVMGSEVGALAHRTGRSERRLARAGERLRAVSHPLRASVTWPVSGPLLEPYGPRGSGWHSGIDIDAPVGAPVSAAAPGYVVRSGWDEGYGNRIVLAHGRGLETVYAHLAEVSVDPGVFVSEWSQIGSVGCTGTCDGAHLHFEVRINGEASDPLLWLPPHPARLAVVPAAD